MSFSLPDIQVHFIKHQLVTDPSCGPADLPASQILDEATVIFCDEYHQLHAVALVSRLLNSKALIAECRRKVGDLIEPVIRDKFYYQVGPEVAGEAVRSAVSLKGTKEGLCAYCVTPAVQGLAELHPATGAEKYRKLALQAADWFSGRNDAGEAVHDPDTGLCADGIDGGTISPNRGAESSIEAGMAEIEKEALLQA